MRRDLKLHQIVGLAIALVCAYALFLFTPILPFFAALLGWGLAHITGRLKEYWYDRRTPGRTVDRADWVATSRGGLYGALLFLLIWALVEHL